jgi:hypothetical protein
MMMPIPIGLTVIFWMSLVLAAWLVFVIRDDYSKEKGVTKLWFFLQDGISQALILMMLLTATLQVVARYVLPAEISVPWTEEGGRLMMVWVALWGAAALQRADDHICMTAVYDALGNVGKRLMLIFSDLVTLALLGLAERSYFGHHDVHLSGSSPIYFCLLGACDRRRHDCLHRQASDGPATRHIAAGSSRSARRLRGVERGRVDANHHYIFCSISHEGAGCFCADWSVLCGDHVCAFTDSHLYVADDHLAGA